MNKSRRMIRLQAQRLATAGFAVLVLDLAGCGDSSGEHREASWAQWLQDGADGVAWLQSQYAARLPVILWGLRSGCLLANELANELAHQLVDGAALLLWNPPASGRVLWQQFLRLATAAAITGEAGKQRAEAIKRQLLQLQIVEIAGYEVSAALWQGLEAASMTPASRPTRVALLETGPQAGTDLSPALAAAADQWREAGHAVSALRVQGPAFWQTTEIEDAPALLDATLKAAEQLVAPS